MHIIKITTVKAKGIYFFLQPQSTLLTYYKRQSDMHMVGRLFMHLFDSPLSTFQLLFLHWKAPLTTEKQNDAIHFITINCTEDV